MTIQQARKILGNIVENIPDSELEKDIKVAELLKVLFFNQNLKQEKKQILNSTYGKA